MLRNGLAKITNLDESRLPASWQIVGDVLIAKMPNLSHAEKKDVAKAAMTLFPRIKTVCEIPKVSGEFRKPAAEKISGDSTETIHTEHGIKYFLDVSETMFSKGNENERHRLEKEVGSGDTVVDMFAGIGYFTLPLARCAERVIAIEKNPVAFGYLTQNIALNKIGNVEPINMDCRAFSTSDLADRVLLGYLPGTEAFLGAALRISKNRGIAHFHNTCHKSNTEVMEKHIREACSRHGCSYDLISVRKVKDYAPNIYHMVADFAVLK